MAARQCICGALPLLYVNMALLKQVLRFALIPIALGLSFESREARALPPLGFTVVDPVVPAEEFSRFDLYVNGDLAYVNRTKFDVLRDMIPNSVVSASELWQVSGSGVSRTTFSHPEFGEATSLTSAIRADDGELYIGANFVFEESVSNNDSAISLYRVDQPKSPVVTWENDSRGSNAAFGLGGIDRRLTGRGISFGDGISGAVEFHADGSFEALPGFTGYISGVTESGYSHGTALTPGTIGTGGAIWDPAGEIEYPRIEGANLITSSIADRFDGPGVNVGFQIGGIRYGEEEGYFIRSPRKSLRDTTVQVSQSQFAILYDYLPRSLDIDRLFGYFPGLVDGKPDEALPLDEIFPGLSGIDIQRISAPYAIDGRVYMAFSSDAGLTLFGALDPSLIPEPSTATLAFTLFLQLGLLRRKR